MTKTKQTVLGRSPITQSADGFTWSFFEIYEQAGIHYKKVYTFASKGHAQCALSYKLGQTKTVIPPKSVQTFVVEKYLGKRK